MACGKTGDSVKSVLMDLTFCGIGYFCGAVFLSLEMIWLSGVWIAASEANFYYNKQHKIDISLGVLYALV